jgi:3-phosphoshikimate 1-carboxyvinyltransferase
MSASLPRLQGVVRVPGDKSIAHRALMLAAMASDESLLAGLPDGGDVASTRECLQRLGVALDTVGRGLRVVPPRRGFAQGQTLDASNSGTTARLLAGVLAGRCVPSRIVGDASLSRRPMTRVAEPLRRMGADVELSSGCLPMRIGKPRLRPSRWVATVPSAQVKSAFLLAALSVQGESVHVEPVPTRDHLERLLPLFGADVHVREGEVGVNGGQPLRGVGLRVPGDPSSAAFLVTAAVLLPGSDVVVEDVVLNPTRIGFVDALRRMGADVAAEPDGGSGRPEPSGNLRARGDRPLGPLRVAAEEVPRLVDELPLLVLAAAFADAESVFEGIGELRVKESDRLEGLVELLGGLGVEHAVEGDTLRVHGGRPLRACATDARGDHRMAMLHAIASLLVPGLEAPRSAAVTVSWPSFHEQLAQLVR